MDYSLAVGSMFLLFFAISALGLGLFTTYFGAGKSRVIGILLTIIGIMVLGLFYLMAIDYWNYGWAMCDVKDSFIGVIAILAGAVASMILVMALMMLIKEKEVGMSDIEQIQKEIEAQESAQAKPAAIGATDDDIPDDNLPVDPEAKESESDAPPPGDLPDEPEELPDEPADEETAQDGMSDYIKEKEENKIVKEDWEKVKDPEPPARLDEEVTGVEGEEIEDTGEMDDSEGLGGDVEEVGEAGESKSVGEEIGDVDETGESVGEEIGDVDETGESVGEEIEEEGEMTGTDVEDDIDENIPETRDSNAEEEGSNVTREVD